jgi:hypothetical protein
MKIGPQLGGSGKPSLQPRAQPLHFFGLSKKQLAGNQFATDADVKQAVIFWLQVLETDFFLRRDTGLGATVRQMLKCQQ